MTLFMRMKLALLYVDDPDGEADLSVAEEGYLATTLLKRYMLAPPLAQMMTSYWRKTLNLPFSVTRFLGVK